MMNWQHTCGLIKTNRESPPARETSIMTTVSIEEAQAKLKELIHQMTPGEEPADCREAGQSTSAETSTSPGIGKGYDFHCHRG